MTPPHARRAAAVLVAAAALFACSNRPARSPAPPSRAVAAERAWPAALYTGRMALTFRQHARADSVFGAFQARFPSAPAAAEASYWRAVTRLDPGNARPDARGALATLASYRALDPPRLHFVEAGIFGALAYRAESLQVALSAERTAAAVAATAAASARAQLIPRDTVRVLEEALERARTEAAEARAELERVRRRLAAPAPRARRAP